MGSLHQEIKKQADRHQTEDHAQAYRRRKPAVDYGDMIQSKKKSAEHVSERKISQLF